MLMLMT